jgi:DHA2 family multidrug resistance protein
VLTPLWMQQTLGYTATDAGYATAFVGVFAVLMSPVAARLVGKVDLRFTVCGGILWLGVISLLRARWSTDSDFWQLATPQLLQGIGMPFFFVGLTALALSSVNPRETTSAAGIMSFVRTLCGAIGTAMATTAWDNASRVSRSELVPSLNGAADVMARLEARGMSHEQARGALDRLVEAQAATIGANHVFTLAFVVFILAGAVIWLAPKPKRVADTSAAH